MKYLSFFSIVICSLVILGMSLSEERALSEISLEEREGRLKRLAKIVGKLGESVSEQPLREEKKMINEKKY